MSRAEAAAGPAAATGQRWRLAAALAVTLVVGYLDRLNVSFAIPLLAVAQGWTREQTADHGSLLMALFYVGYGLANICLTPFAVRVGPRRALLVIVCMWSALTALGAFVSHWLMLFMATRVLLGLAEGVHFPMMSLLTKRWFPPHERSRANGLWIGGIYVAVLSAPLVLVPVMQRFGWRAGFLLLAIAGLTVSLPVILRWVHDQPAQHPRIGVAERDHVEQQVAAEDGPATAGSATPALRAVLGQPAFLLLLAAGILHNVVAVGLTGWLPTYLAGRAGVKYADLSYLAALPYAASFLGLVVWAGLGDRTGRRAGLAAVTYLLAGACLYAGFNASAVWATVGAFAAATFCIACYTATEFALVQRMLPLAHVATGSGVYNGLSMLLGGGLGPVLLKGIVGADATGAALAPVLVPCAVIALLLWRVSRRLAY